MNKEWLFFLLHEIVNFPEQAFLSGFKTGLQSRMVDLHILDDECFFHSFGKKIEKIILQKMLLVPLREHQTTAENRLEVLFKISAT